MLRLFKEFQRLLAIFMIGLLFLSMVFPHGQVFAESKRPSVGTITEEQRDEEELVTEQKTSVDEDKTLAKDVNHLKEGLSFYEDEVTDIEQANEENHFEGNIETSILEMLKEEKEVNVIIRLKNRLEIDQFIQENDQELSKEEKTSFVVERLKNHAETSQKSLMEHLMLLEKKDLVRNVQPLWIINGVAVTLTEDVLKDLSKRKDIEKITLDFEVQAPKFSPTESKPNLPKWGLERIEAPKVWGEYGIKGHGTVVAIMDTGVDADHEALKTNYRGRDGNHKYAWADFSTDGYERPADGHGHGTHVAGTAVGGKLGDVIGVAPEAEWIAVKIFNDQGVSSASAIHRGFEWILAPGDDPTKAPDIVNNSWGSSDPYRTEFLEDFKAWKAAGIISSFSAGNDGPGSETVSSPASFPEAFAIGATDRSDQIAPFSSRGPVTWVDEKGESKSYIKPEVSAPGVEIYSALPGNAYGLSNGTSMASPHVAGTMALLLEANPSLTYEQINQLLKDTTDRQEGMGSIPNNNYGYGIVNAYDAVTEAAFSGTVKGTLKDEEGYPISGNIHFVEEDKDVSVTEEGTFEFKVREGTHTIKVESFGYLPTEEKITVNKDEVLDIHFTLKEAETYSVEGSVWMSGTEKPVTYAYIRVENTPLETLRTSEQGEFRFKDLPEGEYTLVVRGQGIRPKREKIVVKQDEQIKLFVEEFSIQSEQDWPTSNNNFSRNAISEVDIDAGKLVKSWEEEIPGEIVFSSPVVSKGIIVFTTNNGNIVALDQNTGERLWSVRTFIPNRSTPTVVDDVIYVGGGGDNQIHALDLETGIRLWSTEVDFPAVYETPVYHDGVLYISSHMDQGAKIVALDAETGEKLWTTPLGDESFFGPTFGGGMLFAGTYASKELKAFNPDDGQELWSVSLKEEGFSANPVYEDGVLYVTSNHFDHGTGTLWALDATTGEELWSFADIGNTEAASPIVYDEIVVITSAQVPRIKAFDKFTGELLWDVDNGATIVNNGSVSSNGYLFINDLSRELKVYDIFTGDRVYTYELDGSSTSGIALTEGQVIVSDREKIYSFISYGEIFGQIVDEEEKPLENIKVSVEELGITITTDETGFFQLQAKPGDYTLRILGKGYKQIVEEVSFVSGYSLERNFKLEQARTGTVTGTVIDERTKEPLEGLQITLPDLSLETTTDESGEFSFEEVYEGTFDMTFNHAGYVETTETITIKSGETLELYVEITPVDVFVMHDYEGEITNFLTNSGIPAVEGGWEVIEEIDNYEIVYVNGNYSQDGYPTEKQMIELVESAKKKDVSLIFADTWGPSYGSLRYLHLHLEDPENYDSHMSIYPDTIVQVRVDEDHRITEGLDVEATYPAIENGHLAWFSQYSGREIATVGTTREGLQGFGIGYKAISESSAHVLLSTHAASPWASPSNGWTVTQQNLLKNTIEYLSEEARYGLFKGTILDSAGDPLEDVKIEIIDHAYFEISKEDGAFELFHDEGTYEVAFRKTGYETKKMEIDFTSGEPIEKEIILEVADEGTITGTVKNKLTNQSVPRAKIHLYDEHGEFLDTYVSTVGGDYEITNLESGIYTLAVEERGFVYISEKIEVSTEPVLFDIQLYPAPAVGIIGDSTLGSLRDLLAEHGIQAENYANIDAILSDIESFDVIFFNQQSATTVNQEKLERLIEETDRYGVSVIYGDDYYTSSPIHHLVTHMDDPKERIQHSDRSNAAGYVILEEHPIFGEAKVDDFVEILIPNRSNVTSFNGYSGYPLAEIKHSHLEDTYGTAVAYKPRTADNMELLMSGHAVSALRKAEDYTDAGRQMFMNAILWAAYTTFTEVSGHVVDEEGNPLIAEVGFKDLGSPILTDPETGFFSFGSIDGDFNIYAKSFGYKTYEESIRVDESLEPLTIEMKALENNGLIKGQIVNENSLEGIEGAKVYLKDVPRETTTNLQGSFTLDKIEPGTYMLIVEAEDYVIDEREITISEKEEMTLTIELKPSPTIGVIVDSQSSNAVTLDEYLTSRGFIVEHLYYTDLDRIEAMDLIIANSDYNNDLIPEEEEFIAFLKTLDETETPIIWTGHFGPRGSIRFLTDYVNNPKEEFSGRLPATDRDLVAIKQQDHPIIEGISFEDDDTFTFYTDNYYGFRNYTGQTILTSRNQSEGELGILAAVGGRTINSVEVLLSTMTFGYGFTDNFEERKFFDENREKIFNNSILWALDTEDSLVGEIHGKVKNNLGQSVSSTVTVEEIDYTVETEQDGTFFLGLEEGEYTLTIEAFGHKTASFNVQINNGEILEEQFEVISEDLGTVVGTITTKENGEPLEGARIQILGTPLEVTADSEGSFSLQVPEGSYEARISAKGYTPLTQAFDVVQGETTEININLAIAEKIAFVGMATAENRIMPFLEEEGYDVDFWLHADIIELMDRIDEYALVILNDRHTTNMNEQIFKEFIELTDEHGISIIFPSQFGSHTINDLKNFYNDPEEVTNSYIENYVNYRIEEEHPIFTGFTAGDEITLLERDGYNVQYSVFENYSGTALADLTHETGRIGTAVAYDFRTSSSVHVLLSSLKVGTYGSPEDRWTADAKQLYLNTIDWAISASLGEIYGKVTDDEGKPIEGATVEVIDQNMSTRTNEEGEFRFGVGLGNYDVRVEAYGYRPQTKTVTVEDLGQEISVDFVLQKTDRAHLQGFITDENNEGIEDVRVTLTFDAHEAELTTSTDARGYYEFTDLVADDYTLEIFAKGYQTIEEIITLEEGEHLTKNYQLQDYNIAILDDFKSELTDLFEEEGFAAQERDWDIIEDVYNYRVIVINSTDGTKKQLEKLLEEADKYETSLIFTDSWASKGSIKLLEEVLGYPELKEQGYNEGEVIIQPVEDHPIFEGLDEEEIVAFAKSSPYSTFTNFEGEKLANIIVDMEDKGTSIAYSFQSENHMFMLLSSFHVNNMVGPERGWTEQGKQLFVQAVIWARDAKQPLPEKPVWDEEGTIYSNGVIELTGKAEYGTIVSVLSNDEEIATTKPKKDGTFSVKISNLDDGEYILQLQAKNYAGIATAEEEITLIVDQKKPILHIEEPADGLITNKEVITVRGTVEEDHLNKVFINDQEIDIVNERFEERVVLTEGENIIFIRAIDLAGNETTKERTVVLNTNKPVITNIDPVTDQYVTPGDTLTVSFEGSENGDASFSILVPTLQEESSSSIPMIEVEPGYYEGTWTVPGALNLEGGIIQVQLEDKAGNVTTDVADGRLYIYSKNLDRIFGESRFHTAVEISKEGWAQANTVILARNDNFSDALAGVPLAKQLDAPILLTRTKYLPEETEQEIDRLKAKRVIVLGGTLAISEEVIDHLERKGLEVERISGQTRYETAVEIANHIVTEDTTKAVVVNALDFPDAFSVASHAALHGLPILLTKMDELPKVTSDAIQELNITETLVIGGTLAISDKVFSELPGAERISGQTRIGTNIALLEYFGVDTNYMYVATGNDFADSLTGSVLAAKKGRAILLVRDKLEDETINFLENNSLKKLTLFGGTLAISEKVEAELVKYLPD